MPSLSFLVLLPALLSSICQALPDQRNKLKDSTAAAASQSGNYEYIVVGSGAGGGPLAARLAMNGKRVLLIDAGDDQGENLNVKVPTFHAYSTEDPKLAWDFYVKHYSDPEKARMDSKMTWITPSGQNYVGKDPPAGSKMRGILYPRAGTLGGCTAHNALVNIYPHERDWEHIQELTGDETWNPTNMRRIYEKLENVDYLTVGSPGHGYTGWLGVGRADVTIAINDTKLLAMGIAAAGAVENGGPVTEVVGGATNLGRILAGDVNTAARNRDQKEGVYNIPLAEKDYKRNGARDFVRQVYDSKQYPLDIMMNTLVTKVIIDKSGSTPKAMGVEYLHGKSLYRADPRSSSASAGTPGKAMASAEVILSGGIGPAAELAKFNIDLVKDSPGVGTNMQDHFETAVIHETNTGFASVAACTYNRQQPDACLENWPKGRGPYASSNGFVFSVIKKSSQAAKDPVYGNEPDLLMFGGIANFKGYYPGYSNDVYGHQNWTWVVLKAHTGNTGIKAGTVNLASADPRDVPDINFNYFSAGNTANDAHERDLQAMVEGVHMSRKIVDGTNNPLIPGRMFNERLPGIGMRSDAQLKEHIEAEAWSHHASCTVPIGRNDDPMAVLDSKFRVRGVDGLRVVDASVFPRIPGFFIAVPTYMVGEKAAESILFGK